MKIGTLIFTLLFLSLSTVTWSAEIIGLPVVSLFVQTNNGLEKIDNVLKNPEGLLKRYKPAGAAISNKIVDHSQIQFVAKKTVLLFTKSVFIHSSLDVTNSDECSSKSEIGYLLKMDFSGSDEMVTNNVDNYEALICVREDSTGSLNVQVKSKIYKGNNYNKIVGPIITDMIAAQANPITEALSSEIKASQL